MAEFNVDQYFANKAKQEAEFNSIDPWTRIEQRAREQKDRLLQQSQTTQQAIENLRTLRQQQEKSVVGQLGLDPDSVVGSAVNLGASLVSSGSRALGNIASSALDATAMATEFQVDEPTLQAFGRLQAGQATPEDREYFAKPEGKESFLKLYNASERRKVADTVAETMNIGSIVDPTKRQRLSDDLWKGGQSGLTKLKNSLQSVKDDRYLDAVTESITGIASVLANFGETALNNPVALSEYIAEMVPDLALMAVSKPVGIASAMGEGLGAYREGIQKYQAENNGEFPPEELRNWMALNAMGASLADVVGDVSLLKGIKKAEEAGGVANAAVKAGASTTQATEKGLASILGAFARGTTVEGGTETFQTYAEGEARLEPASLRELHEAGFIGAAAGGTISGGLETAQTLAAAGGKEEEKDPETGTKYAPEVVAARQEAITKAKETGDVSAISNIKDAKNFQPTEAVKILAEKIANEQVPEADKKAATQQIKDIQRRLQIRTDYLQKDIELYSNPDKITDIEAQIKTLEERIAQQPNEDAQYELEDLQDQVNVFNKLSTEEREAKLKADQAAFEQYSKELKNIEVIDFGTKKQEETETKDLISQVTVTPSNAPEVDTAVRQEQVNETIVRAMSNPTILKEEDINKLIAQNKKLLSEPQQSFLRTLSKAKAAENALKTADKVSKDIYQGGDGYKGVPQYQTRISSYLAMNDAEGQKQAKVQLAGLKRFADSRQSKFDAATRALGQVFASSDPKTMFTVGLNKETNQWQILDQALTEEEAKEVGALNVNRASRKIIDTIGKEAEYLKQTYGSLSQAFNLTYGDKAPVANAQVAAPAAQPVVANNPAPTVPALQAQSAPVTAAPSQPVASTPVAPATPTAVNNSIDVMPTTADAQASKVIKDKQAIATPIPLSEEKQTGKPDSVESVPEVTDQETEESLPATNELNSTEAQSEVEPIGVDAPKESALPAGGLSFFKRLADEGIEKVKGTLNQSEFFQTNLVYNYFTQRANKESDLTVNALLETENFLSVLASDPKIAAQYLDGKSLSSEQEKYLQGFIKTAQKWNETITSQLTRETNPDFWHLDYIQFFMPYDKVDIDENVKTAMTVAGFQFLLDQYGNFSPQDKEGINSLLLRTDTHEVSPEERDKFTDVVMRESLAYRSIGKAVVKALGLKLDRDAPKNEMERLQTHLGQRTLALLREQGYVSVETVELQRTANGDLVLDSSLEDTRKEPHNFIRLINTKFAERAFKARREANDIVGKLFSIESQLKDPSLEPNITVNKTTKGTEQKVPDAMRKGLEDHHNNQSFKFNTEMVNVVNLLGKNALGLVMGLNEATGRKVHVVNRVGYKGRDESLKLQWQRAKEYLASNGIDLDAQDQGFMGKLSNLKMFFKPEVWKMMRVGLAANSVNPLQNKIQRNVMSMSGWEVEIPTDMTSPEFKSFILGVAESFGIKTDSQSNNAAIEELHKLFSDPEKPHLQAAVDAVIDVLNNKKVEFDSEDQANIAKAVEDGGEELHTLRGLVEYAKWQLAKLNGQEKFTTTMYREIDGKTNGPMLLMFMMGAADTKEDLLALLNKGGFYGKDNTVQEYADFAQIEGNRDLYETLVEALYERVGRNVSKLSGGAQRQREGVFYFTQNFIKESKEGNKLNSKWRNIVKKPIQSVTFGASLDSAVANMRQEFLDSIYGAIEDAVNLVGEDVRSKQKAKLKLKEIAAELNKFGVGMPLDLEPETALEYVFNAGQLQRIYTAFNVVIGNPTKEAMQQQYGNLIEKRQIFTAATNYSFAVYNTIYEHLKAKKLAELTEKDRIANTKGKKPQPLQSLPLSEDQKIRKQITSLMPLMNLALSKDSGDLNSGYSLIKGNRAASQEPAYVGQVKFANPVPTNIGDQATSSSRTYGDRDTLTGPGVAATVIQTHGTDAYISFNSYVGNAVMNVHDANIANVLDAESAAKRLNENTFKALLNFSIPREMADVLGRTLTELPAVLKELGNDPQLVAALNELVSEYVSPKMLVDNPYLYGQQGSPLEVLAKAAYDVAYQSDRLKYEVMEDLTSIDQYTFIGGSYQLKDTDYTAIDTKIKELGNYGDKGRAMAEAAAKIEADFKKTLNKAKVDRAATVQKEANRSAEVTGKASDKKLTDVDVLEWVKAEISKLQAVLKEERSQGITNQETLEELSWLIKFNRAYSTSASNSIRSAIKKVLNTDDNSILDAKEAELNQRIETTEKKRPYLNYKNIKRIKEILTEISKSEFLTEGVRDAIASLLAYTGNAKDLNDLFNKAGIKETIRGNVKNILTKYNMAYQETGQGTYGISVARHNQELVDWLSRAPNGVHSLKDVIKELQKRYQVRGDAYSAYLFKLVSSSLKVLDKDVKVIYASRSTNLSRYTGQDYSTMAAWYSGNNTEGTIVIKGTDFLEAVVTEETLVHEILHAALTGIVNSAEAKTNKQIAPILAELESIRKLAEAHIDANPALAKHKVAVTDLDELIAYGMTDRDFQLEVLAQIQMTGTAAKNTGLRGFIDALMRLFSAITGVNPNGTALGVLIEDVSELFSEAKEYQLKVQESIVRPVKADPLDTALKYTTEGIFDVLGTRPDATNSTEFKQHLKETLQSIVTKLHGPFGMFAEEARQNQALTPEEAYAKAVLENRFPFQSEVLAQPIGISDQAGFVLEQVELVVRESMDGTSITEGELHKLFTEARDTLKPQDLFAGDWSKATPDEIRDTQAIYDYIFYPRNTGQSRSDYLSKFAALGLTYEPLNKALNFRTSNRKKNLSGLKFGEKLQEIFNRILNTLSMKLSKTYAGQSGDQKLRSLVNKLVDLEAKKRASIAREKTGIAEQLDNFTLKARNKVGELADEIPNWKMIKNSKQSIIKGLAAVPGVIANNRGEALLDGIIKIRDRLFKEKNGLAADIITEMRGATDITKPLYRLARMTKNIEQHRANLNKQVKDIVEESFEDAGAYLTSDHKKAITAVLLRTGLSDLVDRYSHTELMDLVSDRTKLMTEIDRLENDVGQASQHGWYYVKAAHQTGYSLVTGKYVGRNVLMNADNIVNLRGTTLNGKTDLVSDKKQEVTDKVDTLISLYAIRHSNSVDLNLFNEVLTRELPRKDQSGLVFVLNLHRQMKEESLKSLFNGNKEQMAKGYTRDTYDPYKSFQIASEAEGELLEKQGWIKSGMVRKDPADPDNEPKYLYVVRDGGMVSRVTGAISNTSLNNKGTLLFKGETRNQSKRNLYAIDPEIQAMHRRDKNYDPSKTTQSYSVPLLDDQGNVVNYRYMMSRRERDELLQRQNEMDSVLGTMAGSILDKQESPAQNERVINALYEQYQEDSRKNPEAYIEVSLQSTDPEIREIWKLLPEHTKDAVQLVWGEPKMYVRRDVLNLVFGYRKYSVQQIFEKEKQHRNIMERLTVTILEGFFGTFKINKEKVPLKAKQIGLMWDEVIKEAKDILVIKNVATLIGNISSNVTELLWFGVSPKDIVRNHIVAIRSLMQYQKTNNELIKLEKLIQTGYVDANDKRIQARVVELKDTLARSPIKEMVDAGMFQTIVEDIDTQQDDYSYKSMLAHRVEKYTDKIPKWLKDTGETLYIGHNTPIYKFLNSATYMSDFVARYTLHQHLTTRQEAPLSKEQSLDLVSEAFVNYDIPSHKALQYLNDKGLLLFTKYYLRIQKILFMLFRDNPAKGLGLVAMDQYFSSIPNLTESSMFNKFGNPFNTGIFVYPDALDELATVKAANYVGGLLQ